MAEVTTKTAKKPKVLTPATRKALKSVGIVDVYEIMVDWLAFGGNEAISQSSFGGLSGIITGADLAAIPGANAEDLIERNAIRSMGRYPEDEIPRLRKEWADRQPGHQSGN